MRSISVSQLKARLSEQIEAVRAGEEVVVTDRGKAVARIVPIRGAEAAEGHLRALIRAGAVRPPRAPVPEGFWTIALPPDPEASVRRALEEEREGGW